MRAVPFQLDGKSIAARDVYSFTECVPYNAVLPLTLWGLMLVSRIPSFILRSIPTDVSVSTSRDASDRAKETLELMLANYDVIASATTFGGVLLLLAVGAYYAAKSRHLSLFPGPQTLCLKGGKVFRSIHGSDIFSACLVRRPDTVRISLALRSGGFVEAGEYYCDDNAFEALKDAIPNARIETRLYSRQMWAVFAVFALFAFPLVAFY